MSFTQTARTALWRPGPAESGRKAVLAAAAELFVRHGYLATSMDAIADRLGSTKGRIYHYYRGKPEIFLDVVEHGMNDLLMMIEPITADPSLTTPERLHEMIKQHAKVMMEESHPQAVAVQMVQYRRVPELAAHADTVTQIMSLRRQYLDHFATVLTEGIATGELLDQDVDLASKTLLGALNWIPVWYRPERGSETEVERIATYFADTLFRAMMPRGS